MITCVCQAPPVELYSRQDPVISVLLVEEQIGIVAAEVVKISVIYL